MKLSIMDVRKGDIVRFKSYALRVEHDPVPVNNGTGVILQGRTTKDGCPLERKMFPAFAHPAVEVERP